MLLRRRSIGRVCLAIRAAVTRLRCSRQQTHSRPATAKAHGRRKLRCGPSDEINNRAGVAAARNDQARWPCGNIFRERKEQAMTDSRYLIIGGGMTAAAAADGIREVDSTGTI